jgi:hypothetical protein
MDNNFIFYLCDGIWLSCCRIVFRLSLLYLELGNDEV